MDTLSSLTHRSSSYIRPHFISSRRARTLRAVYLTLQPRRSPLSLTKASYWTQLPMIQKQLTLYQKLMLKAKWIKETWPRLSSLFQLTTKSTITPSASHLRRSWRMIICRARSPGTPWSHRSQPSHSNLEKDSTKICLTTTCHISN